MKEIISFSPAEVAGTEMTPSEDGQVPHEFTNNAKDGMQFDYQAVDEMETGKRSTAYGDASTCQATNQPEPSATIYGNIVADNKKGKCFMKSNNNQGGGNSALSKSNSRQINNKCYLRVGDATVSGRNASECKKLVALAPALAQNQPVTIVQSGTTIKAGNIEQVSDSTKVTGVLSNQAPVSIRTPFGSVSGSNLVKLVILLLLLVLIVVVGKILYNKFGKKKESISKQPDLSEDDVVEIQAEDEEQDRTTWQEKFKSRFTMPTLPPFLTQIMSGVPMGYEEPMLLHMLSMLGAMCFSKVRALYLDGIAHAANLQVVVEGNWGTGKAKFEQLFKVLFGRVLSSSKNKIDLLSDPDNRIPLIVQTTGIGTSMSKYVDILADNQECHMYIFNSEVRALFYDLKKGNGLNFDFLRKAFENGDVCRNNKARDSKNGIFPIYLNYTLTGTPADINTSFKKELEGGTLSRICWCTIPKQGREPSKLIIPYGVELESLRDQIDGWREKYCFHTTQNGDVAVEEYLINLDYVNEALDEWCKKQYDQAKEENNTARADVRLRIGTIAFHCAIIFHMLFGEPDSEHKKERKQVVDLTLYVANYCMERFLHKFGKEQNEQHKKNQEAELVNEDPQNAIDEGSSEQGKELITDIAELARLHNILDENGQHKYGWDKLVQMSGIPKSTLKRKIAEYETNKNEETD